jgi:hypothetical protein
MAAEMTLADHVRAFAESSAQDGAPTYAAICRSVADDAEVLGLLAGAPPTQRRPNLLLAAVHFLLLGGADHPLAAYYDTVAAYRGTTDRQPVDDPNRPGVGAAFRDFCLGHREALLELIATGSTQTNEVGRCTALLPALNAIAAAEPGRSLGLLDLGTSAGLNLLFDRYGYTYRQRSDGATATAGDPASPVQLECLVRGDLDGLPALARPELAGRAGLDRAPIDPHDEAGSRWLLACLWPDHLPRFARLQAALEIARADPDLPPRHTGDMIEQLGPVAATVAPGQPLVVFHSWVAAYLSPSRQRELVEAVAALSGPRPVHHLYAESPFDTPGLPTPPPPVPHRNADTVTALVHIAPGGRPVRLADLHPHGRSLRWWARPTGTPTRR